ncbi:MAG: CBS domain-containing protein [Planctomycetota bacterium]
MVTSQTEEKGKAEAEAKAEAAEAKSEPEAEAKVETEEKAEAEPEAKPEAEAAEEPKAEAEEKAKTETEAKPEAEAVEEKGKPEAENKGEAEEKTETEEKTKAPDQSQESAKGGVSETIQKMTQSPAVLPGESGKPTIAHISVPSTICAKDVMQKDVAWAGPEESVQQALTKMQQHDSSYIIVGQDGALEGIVSKSDITGAASIYLRPIFAKWHGPGDDATLQIKLKWIMSRPVRTIRPEAPLATIIENMCRFGGRGLPVADEQGKVQGLVTVFDIFRTLLNTSEDVSAVGKTAEAPALE